MLSDTMRKDMRLSTHIIVNCLISLRNYNIYHTFFIGKTLASNTCLWQQITDTTMISPCVNILWYSRSKT